MWEIRREVQIRLPASPKSLCSQWYIGRFDARELSVKVGSLKRPVEPETDHAEPRGKHHDNDCDEQNRSLGQAETRFTFRRLPLPSRDHFPFPLGRWRYAAACNSSTAGTVPNRAIS
jgi:hypothetical protein